MKEIQQQLFQLQDEDYKAFHSKLIPNISPERIIGVRTPALRSFAKNLLRAAKKDNTVKKQVDAFLSELPHEYYDENNLHAFLIEGIKDYDDCIAALDRFLPYVDNWATCDMLSPKVLARHRDRLLSTVQKWLSSTDVYVVRYGIGVLMRYYLEDLFEVTYLDWAAEKCCDEYYINMMVAWYFATALAKQYEATLPYLEEHRLPEWTHHKTIRKAIESNRITPEQKAYLRTI